MADSWWVGEEDLDNDQKEVIALPIDKSFLVTGPAGCGKTNLLLLRANYHFLAGEANIQVVVFTRTLQEFMSRGGAQYDFPLTKLVTSRKWQLDLLYQYGRKVKVPDDKFEKQREFLCNEVANLVKEKKLSSIYQAILLDEAQDYLPEEIEAFSRLAKVFFAVADSKQKIYEGADPIQLLSKSVEKTIELTYHYRNGRRICRLADAIAKDAAEYKPMLPTCQYDEAARPSSVERAQTKDIKEQSARIAEKLATQLKAYPDELLGVVAPRWEELKAVWDYMQTTPLAPSCFFLNDPETDHLKKAGGICFSTIHSAKGLEFRTVHIAGLEYLKRFPFQRNVAYTGITRAKTSLSLYHSGMLPGFLESAIKSLEPAPEPPKLSKLFGKSK